MSQNELLTLAIFYSSAVVIFIFFWWWLGTKVERLFTLLEYLANVIEPTPITFDPGPVVIDEEIPERFVRMLNEMKKSR